VESAQREIRQIFSRPPSIHNGFLVAVDDRRVIGCAGFHIDAEEDVEGVYWVDWLYVRPDCHQQGIGGRLLSALEERLSALRARKLYLDVGNESDQPAATAFYLKHGFIKEGELIDYFKDGENKQIFAKRLG
jgi:ribosomal protein S18 acetylase RimI-like enzyme